MTENASSVRFLSPVGLAAPVGYSHVVDVPAREHARRGQPLVPRRHPDRDRRDRRRRVMSEEAHYELRDVAPGLWIWRREHPDWTPDSDWKPWVTSTCVTSGGETAVLDALLPH